MARRDKPPRRRPDQPPPSERAKRPAESNTQAKASISFEYYETGGAYCLSQYNSDQVRSFLDGLRKISERTWQQLIEGASRNPAMKTGLNPTRYARSDLRNPDMWPTRLSQELTHVIGMRATDRRRVFGVRVDQVFYVLWFDEDHGIVAG